MHLFIYTPSVSVCAGAR